MNAFESLEGICGFFGEMNLLVKSKFQDARFEFRLIGYAALMIAGLPERGTKDIDALKIGVFADPSKKMLFDLLMSEFGKDGPSARRHGMYLDLIDINIPWLPPKPRFSLVKKFTRFDVLSLAAADVCASKIFAAFKSVKKRPNDESDVIAALNAGIVSGKRLIERLDDAFICYETHAEAPDVFPRVISFASNIISPYYAGENIQLKYQLPRWMKEM